MCVCVCGVPCRGDGDIFTPACILLRLQFIHVTDMTEPVALAPGSPRRFLGGPPGRCVRFIQSQVGAARPWMCVFVILITVPPGPPRRSTLFDMSTHRDHRWCVFCLCTLSSL